MKQISMILLLLAALWLPGCSVEEIGGGKGNPLPEGVTRLSAAIASGTQTKAVGDKLADATANEKRIDRMAFVVHTEAEGMQVYPPLKTGEQAKDFPNKVVLTDNGDGTYSATVDLTNGAGHEADIVALANLPEDYDYSQIVTWKGLLDSVTVSTQTMPGVTDPGADAKALIMQGNTTVTLHKEKEEKFSLSMERLVARIDITNMAYSGEADKGFILTGARVLRAMPASYLYPHDLYASPDTVTVTHESWSFDDTAVKYYMGEVEDANVVAAPTQDAADRQAVWHNLYTYENSDTEHAPTALEISGTFRGMPITRQIPFEAVQADGITRKAFPIVRNHRYLLLIKPAPGLTDLTYEVKVDEWNAIDTINVQPNQTQMPVYTGYTAGAVTKSYGITADRLMPDTLVVPAGGGTFTFKAACPFDTRVTFGYASDGLGDATGWLSATSSDPTIVTRASSEPSYEREYTVTVAADAGLDASLVNRGYIYIANGGNGSMVDTVAVFQGADMPYPDTRSLPVTIEGVVWAPVNVGAKAVPTEITADISGDDRMKYCGYYYQWGRNVPFKYGVTSDIITPTTYPLYTEAYENTGMYANKFIVNPAGSPGSWFSDCKTPSLSSELVDMKWPRKNQPCPVGWRISTEDELTVLYNKIGSTATPNNGILTVEGLVLPNAGFRGFKNGVSYSESFYLSSILSTTGHTSALHLINSSVSLTKDLGLAAGVSVRCVKE